MATFLLLKKWKKPNVSGRPRKALNDKKKKEYEEKAMNLRKVISIAKAKLERLRENRKLTKKGTKNRRLLLEE